MKAAKIRQHLNSRSPWLKSGFNKWRAAFFIFAVVYAFFLTLDLTGMSMQWDEVTHLNGGVLLLRGDFQTYFSFNAFYPPMYDVVTMGFFGVGGVSVFAGRFVSVVFSLLSLYAVFEFVYRMYGPKTALLSSVLLGVMPGYVWLSRMAMIETMLVFFFTVSLMLFFNWLRTRQNKMLVLSGFALGLGFLTKYQMLIAGVIMVLSMLLLSRQYLKARLKRFPILIVTVVVMAVPWFLIAYQIYASGMLDQWIYALQIGNPEKLLYSTGLDRLPQWFTALPAGVQLPLFYFVEMTWPYSNVHPISIYLYILGLAGLGLFAWRRKTEDKYLLVWFFATYVFFTLITNKQWRYMAPVFPVLAISAASLITPILDRAGKTVKSAVIIPNWKSVINVNRKRAFKATAAFFTVFLAASVFLGVAASTFLSVSDAHYWVAKDQVYVPIEEATGYAAARLAPNESIMVMCAQNLFSQDMVRFFMLAEGKGAHAVVQYPELPVDTYEPHFNITEFVGLCRERNVKYVFTYEFGGDVPYFNTTESLMTVYEKLYLSGSFAYLSGDADMEELIKNGLVPAFGANPRRIMILTFLG